MNLLFDLCRGPHRRGRAIEGHRLAHLAVSRPDHFLRRAFRCMYCFFNFSHDDFHSTFVCKFVEIVGRSRFPLEVSRVTCFGSIRLARHLFHLQWHISAICDNRRRADDRCVVWQVFSSRSDGHHGRTGYIVSSVIDVTSLELLTGSYRK